MYARLLKSTRWVLDQATSPAILMVAGFVTLLSFTPLPVFAGPASFFAQYILLPIAQFLGGITLTLIGILVEIVQYNDFINAPAVVKGWVVMRDVVNMFFIVILLAISFGTMFRMEEYQYKHHLGKLLTMAVLVNFSKSISGFFIDFAQVIMLTFVNGFKDAAAGNFINGFQLDKMFQFAKEAKPEQYSDSTFFYAALLALITIAITTVVIGVYLVVFVLRIVALWFLIIISPLAFLANAWPGKGHEYHEEWWDYFGKYATSGPILAFFLWLSLAVMQFSNNSLGDFNITSASVSIPAAAVTELGRSDVLLSFIISITLLIGGLWMTSKLGVAGGGMASGAIRSIQKAGTLPFKGARRVGRWGLNRLDDAQAGIQKKLANTRLGQAMAKTRLGEGLGLGKIAEHGIQVRTLKHAWQERSKRKERERLGASAGVAEDIMSRAMSFGSDKPNKTAEENARLATEAAKEVTAVSTDWEHLASEIDEAMDYSSGKPRVRAGKEHLVEGLLVELSKTHDPNEVLKHTKLGKNYGLEYTPQNVVEFLKDAFGGGKPNESVARVAFRMQEAGLTNSDGLLKGIARMRHGHYELPDYFEESIKGVMTSNPDMSKGDAHNFVMKRKRDALEETKRNELALRDPEQGGHGKAYNELPLADQQSIAEAAHSEVAAIDDGALQNMIRKEEQGKVATAFIAKRTFRSIANQSRFQDFLAEVADQLGNRYAGKLTDVGIANVGTNGAALAQHYAAMNEETKKNLGENVDQFVKYFEENFDSMGEEVADNWKRFISAIALGKAVQNEKELITPQELKDHIENYTKARNGNVAEVNNNRRKGKINDVEGVELQDNAPIYHLRRDNLYGSGQPQSGGGVKQGGEGQGDSSTETGKSSYQQGDTIYNYQYRDSASPQPSGGKDTKSSPKSQNPPTQPRGGGGTQNPDDTPNNPRRGGSSNRQDSTQQPSPAEASSRDQVIDQLGHILDQYGKPARTETSARAAELITPKLLAPAEFTEAFPSVGDLVAGKISLEGFQFSEQDRKKFLGHILGAIKGVKEDLQVAKEQNRNPDLNISANVGGVLGDGPAAATLQALLAKQGGTKSMEEILRMDIQEALRQLLGGQAGGSEQDADSPKP